MTLTHEFRAWRAEKSLASLYRALSDLESGHPRQLLFLELAREADAQAALWTVEIRKSGKMPPVAFVPGWKLQTEMQLLRLLGPRSLRGWLRRREVQGLSVYDRPDPRLPDDPEQIALPAPMIPAWATRILLRIGLPAFQEGLVALWLLVMAVEGYASGHSLTLILGIAGLLAGGLATASAEALSPAPGLSTRPPQTPDEVAAPVVMELVALYRRRGMPETEARTEAVKWLEAQSLVADWVEPSPVAAPETELPPWQAALVVFLAFTFGGLIPLLPYWMGMSRHLPLTSTVLTMPAVMWAGGLAAKMQGRGGVWGGLRAATLTGLAGGIAYVLGRLAGS